MSEPVDLEQFARSPRGCDAARAAHVAGTIVDRMDRSAPARRTAPHFRIGRARARRFRALSSRRSEHRRRRRFPAQTSEVAFVSFGVATSATRATFKPFCSAIAIDGAPAECPMAPRAGRAAPRFQEPLVRNRAAMRSCRAPAVSRKVERNHAHPAREQRRDECVEIGVRSLPVRERAAPAVRHRSSSRRSVRRFTRIPGRRSTRLVRAVSA